MARPEDNGAGPNEPMEPERVRAQLARILAHRSFADAPQLSRLLRHLVEHALTGASGEVKEYLLGMELFGRGTTFNPRLDTIVRSHARRLRVRLDAYFTGPGRSDPIVIEVPKGRYRAVFRANSVSDGAPRVTRSADDAAKTDALSAEFERVSIAALPFENHGNDTALDAIASGLVEDILTDLAHYPVPNVASRTAASSPQLGTTAAVIGAALNVDYLLEGSVRGIGANVRVTARLIRAKDGYHVWSRQYERSRLALADTRDLAKAIAFQARSRLLTDHNDQFWLAHPEVLGGTRRYAVELFRQAWEIKRNFDTGEGGMWSVCASLLERAIEFDPTFYLGHIALLETYVARAGWEIPFDQVRREGYAALARALSTHTPDAFPLGYLYLGKLLLIDCEYDAAIEMFRRGRGRDPDQATVYSTWLARACIAAGRTAEAREARRFAGHSLPHFRIETRELFLYHEGRADAAYGNGQYAKAIQEYGELLNIAANERVEADVLRSIAKAEARLGNRARASDLAAHASTLAGAADPEAFVPVYALIGDEARARKLLSAWNGRDSYRRELFGRISYSGVVEGCIALRDFDGATMWLKAATRDWDWFASYLRHTELPTWLEPLRNDSRWADLMQYIAQHEVEARAAGRAVRHSIPIIAKYDPTAR